MYGVIYADPPWSYHDKCCAGKRGAEFKYPVLGLQALIDLPVRAIAAPDALLFLWATGPLLPDALRVMEAWGFPYRTPAFTWVKTTGPVGLHFPRFAWGMGNWTRSNAEFCLLGIRGKPKRASASVHQVVLAPRMQHSAAKPPEVRDRIDQLVGSVPARLELFARERAPGWEATGLELDGKDVRDFLQEEVERG
jgi:site-specific DNA-methyltransferase (adenine-specific)